MSGTVGSRPESIFNRFSFDFDGTDDSVEVPDADNLSFGNGTTDSPFSISCWANVSQLTSAQFLFRKRPISSAFYTWEYDTYISSTGAITFRLFDVGSVIRVGRTTSTGLITTDTWNHIIFTYDGRGGSTAYDGIKIYLNGTRVDNANLSNNTYTAMHNLSSPVLIGTTLTGNIDEVAIWDSELSASDVTNIYNSGVPNDLSSLSPFSWWRMGDNATWNGSNWLIPDSKSVFSRKSIELDGVDDFVNCGNQSNLNFSADDAFSLSVWFKKGTQTGFAGSLLRKQEPSGLFSGYNMYILDDKVHFRLREDGSRFHQIIDNNTHPLNTWVHYVATYDGSRTGSGGGLNLYKNGTLLTNVTRSGNFSSGTGQSNEILGIGGDTSLGYLNGNIDEVAIWDSELSASDVTAIYNSGVPNDISSLSPLSWWRCGDGDTSPTLTDNGSGGNNGTMTNFSTFSIEAPTLNHGTSTNMTEDSRKLSTTQFDKS